MIRGPSPPSAPSHSAEGGPARADRRSSRRHAVTGRSGPARGRGTTGGGTTRRPGGGRGSRPDAGTARTARGAAPGAPGRPRRRACRSAALARQPDEDVGASWALVTANVPATPRVAPATATAAIRRIRFDRFGWDVVLEVVIVRSSLRASLVRRGLRSPSDGPLGATAGATSEAEIPCAVGPVGRLRSVSDRSSRGFERAPTTRTVIPSGGGGGRGRRFLRWRRAIRGARPAAGRGAGAGRRGRDLPRRETALGGPKQRLVLALAPRRTQHDGVDRPADRRGVGGVAARHGPPHPAVVRVRASQGARRGHRARHERLRRPGRSRRPGHARLRSPRERGPRPARP